MDYTVATANVYGNVSANRLYRVCGNGSVTITVGSLPTSGATATQIPAIKNASLIIKKIAQMNNETKMPWNYDILNIISIASYLLSIQNLQLNQQQTSNDDINKHLQDQDKILHEQNARYLTKIIQQNEERLTLS